MITFGHIFDYVSIVLSPKNEFKFWGGRSPELDFWAPVLGMGPVI